MILRLGINSDSIVGINDAGNSGASGIMRKHIGFRAGRLLWDFFFLRWGGVVFGRFMGRTMTSLNNEI